MVITKIYPVGKFKIIQIIGEIDGKPTARCIAPLTSKGEPTPLKDEPPAVKTACLKAWTDEVKEAYQAHMEEVI